MELKNLINKMNNEEISLDPQEIKIGNLLIDRKYNILNTFLKEKGIVTTNDLKKMNVSDYNKLKMNVPDIEGVGVEKTNLFIKVLDSLRKDNHTHNVSVLNDVYPKVENLGKIKTSPNWSIEINSIKIIIRWCTLWK